MFDQTSDQLKAYYGESVGFNDVNGKLPSEHTSCTNLFNLCLQQNKKNMARNLHLCLDRSTRSPRVLFC